MSDEEPEEPVPDEEPPIEPLEPELEPVPVEDPELPEEPELLEPFGMISICVTLEPEKLART